MKKLNILFFIIVIFNLMLITSVLSEVQTLGTFKRGSCINLKQTCANCTSVNITSIITDVNSTNILGLVPMTKIGTEYNYTLCNTSILGKYIISGVGNVDGVNTIWIYDLFVTPSGYTIDTSKTIVLFFILSILMLITILLFIFGIKAEMPVIKLFCLGLAVLLLIFSIGYIMSIANLTIGEFSDLTSVFTNIYIMFIGIITVGGIGLILYLIYYAFEAFYKHRGLK